MGENTYADPLVNAMRTVTSQIVQFQGDANPTGPGYDVGTDLMNEIANAIDTFLAIVGIVMLFI
jgi:hypothetical protein